MCLWALLCTNCRSPFDTVVHPAEKYQKLYKRRGPVLDRIVAMQWNPHWECFVSFSKTCGAGVKYALDAMLALEFLDFVTIVELAPDYVPPGGYAVSRGRCGKDVISLIYNRLRWQPVLSATTACLDDKDRASVVQPFRYVDKSNGISSFQFTVVGGHLPHPQYGDLKPLTDAIVAFGGDKLLFMGDTNRETSSQELLCEINPIGCASQSTHLISTELFHSCCKNTGFAYVGFDRVFATFGHAMQTEPKFSNVSWGVGEFHRGVVATFSL